MDARLALAKSHLAQAGYLLDRLNDSTVIDDSARQVLWSLKFSLEHAAEVLIKSCEDECGD